MVEGKLFWGFLGIMSYIFTYYVTPKVFTFGSTKFDVSTVFFFSLLVLSFLVLVICF